MQEGFANYNLRVNSHLIPNRLTPEFKNQIFQDLDKSVTELNCKIANETLKLNMVRTDTVSEIIRNTERRLLAKAWRSVKRDKRDKRETAQTNTTTHIRKNLEDSRGERDNRREHRERLPDIRQRRERETVYDDRRYSYRREEPQRHTYQEGRKFFKNNKPRYSQRISYRDSSADQMDNYDSNFPPLDREHNRGDRRYYRRQRNYPHHLN